MADEIPMAVGKHYSNTAVVIFRLNSISRQSYNIWIIFFKLDKILIMKIYYSILTLFILSSCTINSENKNSNLEAASTQNAKKILIHDFGELDFLSEDNKYGRVVIEAPSITENVVSGGTVIGYVQRPANEESPERWSQLPQFNVSQENPTYVYFSFSEGIIRISLQSETSVIDAAYYFKDKKLKFIVSK